MAVKNIFFYKLVGRCTSSDWLVYFNDSQMVLVELDRLWQKPIYLMPMHKSEVNGRKL